MDTSKPKCAVQGMLSPRAMCGSVIVGCVYCGHDGPCEHKVEPGIGQPAPIYANGHLVHQSTD